MELTLLMAEPRSYHVEVFGSALPLVCWLYISNRTACLIVQTPAGVSFIDMLLAGTTGEVGGAGCAIEPTQLVIQVNNRPTALRRHLPSCAAPAASETASGCPEK